MCKHPTLFLPLCPTPGCRAKNLEQNWFFHVFPWVPALAGALQGYQNHAKLRSQLVGRVGFGAEIQ